jgi:hypothetical protein
MLRAACALVVRVHTTAGLACEPSWASELRRVGAAPGRQADGPRRRRTDNWHTTMLVGLTSVASVCLNRTAYWDSRIELLHRLDLDLSLFSINDLIAELEELIRG